MADFDCFVCQDAGYYDGTIARPCTCRLGRAIAQEFSEETDAILLEADFIYATKPRTPGNQAAVTRLRDRASNPLTKADAERLAEKVRAAT